jgi:signal peptidase I
MILRWLASKAVREAMAAHKHYRRMLAAQQDILSPQAVAAVRLALTDLTDAVKGGKDKGVIRLKAEALQFAAEKWLKPYPHAAWRENIEVFLVALAVAMGIRTFFLQPFKIPTGSMQPTLFGVTSVPDFSQSKINYRADREKVENQIQEQANLRNTLQIPAGWERIKEWFKGNSYVHVVAHSTGTVQFGKPVRFLIFNLMQKVRIGDQTQTLWFPPDFGEQPVEYRSGLFLDPHHVFNPGDEVIKMKVSAGDHLFVDRLTYNFRKPERGETIVFETEGIPENMRERYRIPADQFYIKRLVGLPGEKVQIGDDRHLIVNGKRLDASTPHFGRVYGFDPSQPPRDSQWSGHVNGTVAEKYDISNLLASPGGIVFFPDQQTVVDVPTNGCLPMGDNTCNSLDSRFWGPIPEKYVIGKSFFVYWPITPRFGTESNY